MDTANHWISGILAFLLLTSFLKIFVTLSILRFGLNLEQGSFGLITAVASVALTIVVMAPHLSALGGIEGLLQGGQQGITAHAQKLKPFLEQHVDAGVLGRVHEAPSADATPGGAADRPAQTPETLVAAFVMSELRSAFSLGVMLLIPFLVIDLLVANVLLALGAQQLSVVSIALPLKLLLFVAVDGWALLTSKLLTSYAA